MRQRPATQQRGSAAAKRLIAAATAAGLLLLVATLAVRVIVPESPAAAIVSPTSLLVDAPSVVAAGESLEIGVRAPVADRTDVALGVFSAVESTLLKATVANGVARFTLQPVLLDHAGRVTLVAQVGATRTTHDIIVTAGPAVEPVVPLVGPRTIVADGQDITMVVVSPGDEFGNPLDGALVEVQVVRPDGLTERFSPVVEDGIAASILTADTTAGRVSIVASVDGKNGPVNVVDQVAGRPGDFTVTTVANSSAQLFADGFTLYEVSTSALRDAFGNLLPDGVVTTFEIESPDGLSFAEATVQGGYATADLESPSTPGPVTVRARTSGRTSSPLSLQFMPAVKQLTASISHDARGLAVVEVGPVVTVNGGYPADGTLVELRDATTRDPVASASLYRGAASVTLRDSLVAPIIVEVLGARTELSLPGAD